MSKYCKHVNLRFSEEQHSYLKKEVAPKRGIGNYIRGLIEKDRRLQLMKQIQEKRLKEAKTYSLDDLSNSF